MPNLAFNIVANMVNNVGPASKQITQNFKNLKQEFGEGNEKLINLQGSASKVGGALSKLTGGIIDSGAATKGLSTAFAGLSPQMVAALGTAAAFAAVAAKLGVEFLQLTQKTARLADELDKASQRVGLTAQEFDTLNFQLGLAGSSMKQLEPGFKALQKNAADAAKGVGEAKDAFKALGINTVDSNGNLKNSSDLFEEVTRKLRNLEDQTLRSAYAQRIFGEGGSALIPFLNTTNEEIEVQRRQLELLGGAMEDLTKDNGAALISSQGKISKGFENIGNALVTEAMGEFADTLDNIVDSGVFEYLEQGSKVLGTVLAEAINLVLYPIDILSLSLKGLIVLVDSIVVGIFELLSKIPKSFLPEGWSSEIEAFRKGSLDVMSKDLEDLDRILERLEGREVSPNVEGAGGGGGASGSRSVDTGKVSEEVKNLNKFMDDFFGNLDGWEVELSDLQEEFEDIDLDPFTKMRKNLTNNKEDAIAAAKMLFEEADRLGRDIQIDGEIVKVDEIIDRIKQVYGEDMALLAEEQQRAISDTALDIQEETSKLRLKLIEDEYERRSQEAIDEYDTRKELLQKELGDSEEFNRVKLALEEQLSLELLLINNERLEEEDEAKRLQLEEQRELEIEHANEILELKREHADLAYELEQLDSERISSEYDHRLELLRRQKDDELAEVEGNAEAKALVEKNYQKRVQLLNKETQDKIKKNTAEGVSSIAGTWASYFQTRAEMEKDAYGESTKESKKFGELYKAAAIVQTTIDTFSAAMGAYDALASIPYVGPALGAAAAAATIAFGGVQIAKISQQSFQEGGFPQGANATVRVNEDGQEAILNARATRALGREGVDALNEGRSVGNNINISPSITINGPADDRAVSNITDELDSFARRVEAVFERGVIDTSRITGAFA